MLQICVKIRISVDFTLINIRQNKLIINCRKSVYIFILTALIRIKRKIIKIGNRSRRMRRSISSRRTRRKNDFTKRIILRSWYTLAVHKIFDNGGARVRMINRRTFETWHHAQLTRARSGVSRNLTGRDAPRRAGKWSTFPPPSFPPPPPHPSLMPSFLLAIHHLTAVLQWFSLDTMGCRIYERTRALLILAR